MFRSPIVCSALWCALLIAPHKATSSESFQVVAHTKNSATIVAATVAPTYTSCATALHKGGEFALDQQTNALWLIDHDARRVADVSQASIVEWKALRARYEKRLRDEKSHVDTDSRFASDFRGNFDAAYRALYEHRKASDVHQRNVDGVTITPQPSAHRLVQLDPLRASIAAARRSLVAVDNDPNDSFTSTTFQCLFDARYDAFTLGAAARPERQLVFDKRDLVSAPDWRTYEKTPLWRMLVWNAEEFQLLIGEK